MSTIAPGFVDAAETDTDTGTDGGGAVAVGGSFATGAPVDFAAAVGTIVDVLDGGAWQVLLTRASSSTVSTVEAVVLVAVVAVVMLEVVEALERNVGAVVLVPGPKLSDRDISVDGRFKPATAPTTDVTAALAGRTAVRSPAAGRASSSTAISASSNGSLSSSGSYAQQSSNPSMKTGARRRVCQLIVCLRMAI